MIERGRDVLRFHRRTELPGDNEAREVVQHGGEVAPAPARDLEIGEVSLPELVDHSIEIEFAYQRRRSRPQSQTRDFTDTPLGAFYDRFRAAIAIGPIFDALRPMISAVVTAIVGVAVTFGVALLKRWTGVSLQATYVDSLRRAAQTEAGVLVAEAADNLSSRSITVTSPTIAAAAARIAEAMPEAVRAAGKTQEDLGRLVTGEIGKLQACATAILFPPGVQKGTDYRKMRLRNGMPRSTTLVPW